jgi:transposase
VQLQTLLNFVEKHKGFVYERVELVRDRRSPQLRVRIRPAARSRGRCSACNTPGPTHDTLDERLFQFVPLWGIMVFFIYAMRRISCRPCGRVVVEAVPWAKGKSTITISFAWFLAAWTKRMSWDEVAHAFHVSWDAVFAAVKMAVDYGLARRKVDDVEVIGVDEIMWRRPGKYMTVVYALDEGRRRLLWLGKDRKEETLRAFFDWFGVGALRLRAIASDMWQPYLNVINERVPWALNVLDRFHITANVHKAVDEVRAEEARALAKQGKQTLKHSRWLLLRAPAKLTRPQTAKLKDLLKINLKTMRAYLLKENLRQLWGHFTVTLGGAFLLEWCRQAKASKLAPMARVARTLERKRDLILNWFRAGGAISSAAVEGLNNKLKVVLRRSYGFRTEEGLSVALYHTLGQLPEPPLIHRFC